MKVPLQTAAAPAAIGPYSQAIESDGLLFCSGQIALDPASGNLRADSIETEITQVLENIKGLLTAAGLDFSAVLKTTVFLLDLKDFEVVNRIYARYFTAPYPARSTVQVAGLPRQARVEVEVIARAAARP